MSGDEASSLRRPGDSPSRGGRFRLLHRGEEVPLEPGQYVVGRGTGADVVVDDPLVSRLHARLLVGDTGVLLEDLRSENGVYVNEQRIDRPVRLEDGDRILVGTHEISFFVRPDAGKRPPSGAMPSLSRPFPPVGPLPASGGELESTLETDALQYLGRLADRMIGMGRARTAERLLSSHLRDVLSAAERRQPVPRDLLDTAGAAALELAAALHDAGWIDFVIRLHHVVGKPFCDAATASLRELLPRVPGVDLTELNSYQYAMLEALSDFSSEERALARALISITSK